MGEKYSFQESLGRLCAEISSGLGKKLELKFKENGLNYDSDEWTVISYLYNNGEHSQNQLTDATKKNKVAISRTVKKFETLNIISRNTNNEDKRVNVISLTEKGEKLYLEMSPLAADVLSASFNKISKKKITDSIETLKLVNRNLKGLL